MPSVAAACSASASWISWPPRPGAANPLLTIPGHVTITIAIAGFAASYLQRERDGAGDDQI